MNVTCLMLTRDRYCDLKRALDCFDRQDYPDRNLLIVTHGASADYRCRLGDLLYGRSDVRCLHLPAACTVGGLRYRAVQEAEGPLVCQWDDDDLYHPRRLSVQISALIESKADACYLRDQLHLFREEGHLYWCDWRHSIDHIGIPNTLLAYKQRLPDYRANLGRAVSGSEGEDTLLQHDLLRLQRNVRVVAGYGFLYMYVYHGQNLCCDGHHRTIIRMFGLSSAQLKPRMSSLCAALSSYPSIGPVTVCDSSGVNVYKWDPRDRESNDVA